MELERLVSNESRQLVLSISTRPLSKPVLSHLI